MRLWFKFVVHWRPSKNNDNVVARIVEDRKTVLSGSLVALFVEESNNFVFLYELSDLFHYIPPTAKRGT